MAGKGDKPRPVNYERFSANYDRIFGGEQKSTAAGQDDGAVPSTSTTLSYGDYHVEVETTRDLNATE